MKLRIAGTVTALSVALAVTACGAASGSVPARSASSGASVARVSPAAETIAKRMGIGNYKAYNADDDPNELLGRNHEYTSKINWSAGSIEVFANEADAKTRNEYVSGFVCPVGDGYDYLYGTALLRLGCSLTPTQTKNNESLFRKAIG